MRLHDCLTAAGVGVHAREDGVLYDEVGRLVVSRASAHGVDENLWTCLRIAADQLFLALDLRPLDTDGGRAVAIVRVGPEGGAWSPATLANPAAIRLVEYLRVHGFRLGEDGADPSVRFGPPHTALNPTPGDYTQHLHVSLPRKRQPDAVAGAVPAAESRGGQVAAVPGRPPPPVGRGTREAPASKKPCRRRQSEGTPVGATRSKE